MFTFDNEIENELIILQSIIEIRLDEKDNPTLNHDSAFLSKYSPANYLEQNPELNYIIGIDIKHYHIFNHFNYHRYSMVGLLDQVTKTLEAYKENVSENPL